jgi:uncharacterized protein YycO
MLIALHKGKSVVSRLIRWQTRSEYSHASLLLEDGCVIESREGSFRTGPGGVRKLSSMPANETVDLFRVEAPVDWPTMLTWLNGQIGKPYDWTMVARFISRRQASRKESGKWFCSELVFAALQKGGVNLLARCEPWEVSPGLLAKSPLLLKL